MQTLLSALSAAFLCSSLALPQCRAAGFTDAGAYGFSPDATGVTNTKALQRAIDQTGTIVVSRPGVYKLAGTILLGSNTTLIFGNNVFIKKSPEQGPFAHVLLNKGALTKTFDQHITVSGLNLMVNGVDVRKWQVYGLHGQVAFFYVKDLHIDHFRCLDLGRAQYAIHICTFEDITIEDVQIRGDKDGVHLGRGKRFTIRNGTFETGDDAIALNAHDYSVGNPELGWIEDGVIENMHDLPNPQRQSGYFCRILAGAWVDWRPGMEVQQSDTVVSGGRLYRVQMSPDGIAYKSLTRPTHKTGQQVLDGITWGVLQDDVTYTAGVRNVVFRDIFLGKARTAFSIHFDNDKYSRSYYPGAPAPRQENILIENARVLYPTAADFLRIQTPVDTITIANSSLQNSAISFLGNKAMTDYGKTRINMIGCIFGHPGPLNLVVNRVPGKVILFKTSGSLELSDDFSAAVVSGGGRISVESDLTGLTNTPAARQDARPAETDQRLNAQGGTWGVYRARDPRPGLPRVLLIGDSVMNGYRAEVCRLLQGKANVDAWVNPYHQASPELPRAVRESPAGGPYRVIHFNMGLHGWQKGRIPDGQFEPLMRAYVRLIQENAAGAKLIWASSTPVTAKGRPGELDPEINAIIVEQNRLAASVVQQAGIPIDDLYPLAASHLDLAKGDQFHWTEKAYRLMAAAVADSVAAALGESSR